MILPGLLMSMFFFNAVEAYEEDVHFFVTMFLAESAGFPLGDAGALARFDQATDDDPSTSPFAGIRQRAAYHFVSISRLMDLEEAARTSCDLRQMGQFLHALEDSYSHKDYEPVLGHAASGHAPDKAYKNPERALVMANKKYFVLAQLLDACHPKAMAVRRWSDIAAKLLTFLKTVPTQAQKDKWNEDPSRLKLLLDGDVSRYQQTWREYQAWKQQQRW
jgi:hypothetical protein